MLGRKHKAVPIGTMIYSGGVGSVLARLIREVMDGIGLREDDRYNALMTRYINRAAMLPDGKKLFVARQGLAVELKKENITWKTFMQGLDFIGAKKFTLTVILKHRDGEETYHSVASPIVRPSEAGSILAKLLWEIFFDLEVHGEKFDRMMRNYIEKTRTRDQIHPRERASIRAALSKEFLKPNITWKTLIKGMLFLDIPEFSIRLALTHVVRASTVHGLTVKIDEIDRSLEDSDE